MITCFVGGYNIKIFECIFNMKKALFLFVLIVLGTTYAFAVCSYTHLCSSYKNNSAVKMGRIISKKTGATYISEKIAELRIKKELKKISDQKFDIYVQSYSLLDSIRGRLKSIVIVGKDLNIEGVYLTYLELKTLCDYNYIQINKNPVRFKENMVIKFQSIISDKDLAKTMESTGYLNKLNCVNISGCGITFFKLSGAGVSIRNNKLNFKIKVISELLLDKPLDISISTDLKVEDGRIVLTKVNLDSTKNKVDLSKVGYRIDAMNPLTFTLNVLENKNTKMCISNIKIDKDRILVSGNVFIPKNVTLSK